MRASILEHVRQGTAAPVITALGALAVGGATLTLGLVQRWGEVFPRWIPVLGGKPVQPRTAIIPASLVAVLVTSAGPEHYRAAFLGDFPRRGRCRHCGVSGPSSPAGAAKASAVSGR